MAIAWPAARRDVSKMSRRDECIHEFKPNNLSLFTNVTLNAFQNPYQSDTVQTLFVYTVLSFQ